MKPRIRIGDRFGKILTEIYADIGPISWRLNQIGQVKLKISKSSTKFKESYWQKGNLVYIDFPDSLGLPAWGGTMDIPYTWGASSLQVTCYEIQHLLKYRVDGGPGGEGYRIVPSYPGVQMGAIMHSLLSQVEEDGSINLDLGAFWQSGEEYVKDYPLYLIWNIITKELVKMEEFDLKFTPQIVGNKIRFGVTLQAIYGNDLTGRLTFKEGRNVESAKIVEQGPIINRFFAAGSGKWSSEDIAEQKIVAMAQSNASIAKYGLRESSKVFSGDAGSAALGYYAEKVITDQAEPTFMLELDVANAPPAKFGEYNIGDSVHCVLPTYTFDGYEADIRIMTREYFPAEGYCKLVVHEVTEVEILRYTGG